MQVKVNMLIMARWIDIQTDKHTLGLVELRLRS